MTANLPTDDQLKISNPSLWLYQQQQQGLAANADTDVKAFTSMASKQDESAREVRVVSSDPNADVGGADVDWLTPINQPALNDAQTRSIANRRDVETVRVVPNDDPRSIDANPVVLVSRGTRADDLPRHARNQLTAVHVIE